MKKIKIKEVSLIQTNKNGDKMKHKIIIELVFNPETKDDIEVEIDNELEHLKKKDRAIAFGAISHYFKVLVDDNTIGNHLESEEKKNVIN